MHKATKNTIFWLITLFTPIIILLLAEMSLRLGGYESEKQDLFVEVPNTPDYLMANTKFISRYFPSFVPDIAPNAFRKQKPSNMFRIFVFGGSTKIKSSNFQNDLVPLCARSAQWVGPTHMLFSQKRRPILVA